MPTPAKTLSQKAASDLFTDGYLAVAMAYVDSNGVITTFVDGGGVTCMGLVDALAMEAQEYYMRRRAESQEGEG